MSKFIFTPPRTLKPTRNNFIKLRRFALFFFLITVGKTLIFPANAAVVSAKKSDDFVNSMGINIKLDRSVYNNSWSQVKNRFQELGIWHYRDGLKLVNNSSTYRARYQSLYDESGAIGLFVWGPWENQGKPGNQAVGAAKKGLDYVAIVSGPNEPDLFWENNYDNDSSTNIWQEVRNYQNSMYNALKGDPATSGIVVTTPPLSTYTKADELGNAGNINCDRISWHFYTGQGHPDKNELTTGLNNTKNGLGKPSFARSDFYTTEAGHNSWKTANPGNNNGTAVSEITQMRYNLRILAEHFRRDVRRTYIHQLMDLGTNSSNFNNSWGIVRADSSKTPKPAFTALKNMISLFKERSWNSSTKTWSNPNFSPGTLDYSITGSTSGVKNVLLQKSNGDFYMLVWVAEDSWNESNDTDKTVSRNITVAFSNAQTIARQTFNNSGGLISGSITSSNANKNWTFTASTTMSILKITNGSSSFSGIYRLESQKNPGKVLHDANEVYSSNSSGNYTIVYPWNNLSAQRWSMNSLGNGYYRIESQKTGKVLHDANEVYASNSSGNYVISFPWNNSTAQKWKPINLGGGFYRLDSQKTGKALHNANEIYSLNSNGTHAISFPWTGSTAQKWKIISTP